MCGIKLKLFSVILVLSLLVSLPVYSESWYPASVIDPKLMELEQIQKDQEEQIEKQKIQEENLKKQQEFLNQQIEDLEKSYKKSERLNKTLKIIIPIVSVVALGGGFYFGYRLAR